MKIVMQECAETTITRFRLILHLICLTLINSQWRLGVFDGFLTGRSITFLLIESHKTAYLVKYLHGFLGTQGVDIMKCFGLTYNNASNMA